MFLFVRNVFLGNLVFAEFCVSSLPRRIHLMCHRPVLTTDETIQPLSDELSFLLWVPNTISCSFGPKCLSTRTWFLLSFQFLVYREEFIWCVTDVYWLKKPEVCLLMCLPLLKPFGHFDSVPSGLLCSWASITFAYFLKFSSYDVPQTCSEDWWIYSDTDWSNVFFCCCYQIAIHVPFCPKRLLRKLGFCWVLCF